MFRSIEVIEAELTKAHQDKLNYESLLAQGRAFVAEAPYTEVMNIAMERRIGELELKCNRLLIELQEVVGTYGRQLVLIKEK